MSTAKQRTITPSHALDIEHLHVEVEFAASNLCRRCEIARPLLSRRLFRSGLGDSESRSALPCAKVAPPKVSSTQEPLMIEGAFRSSSMHSSMTTTPGRERLRPSADHSLERKPRPELELARSVDVVGDLPERETLLRRTDHAGHARVSPLRVIRHVIAGDIEAERFGLG